MIGPLNLCISRACMKNTTKFIVAMLRGQGFDKTLTLREKLSVIRPLLSNQDPLWCTYYISKQRDLSHKLYNVMYRDVCVCVYLVL